MGIFYDQVPIINLAPVVLSVTFDGQQQSIPLGESMLAKVAVAYAKNQNPVPGSADMDNPTMSGARYLISVKGTKDRQEPFTPDEWETMQGKPSRFDTDAFFEERLGPKEHVITRGRGRKVQAKSSFDAGVRVAAAETFAESQ